MDKLSERARIELHAMVSASTPPHRHIITRHIAWDAAKLPDQLDTLADAMVDSLYWGIGGPYPTGDYVHDHHLPQGLANAWPFDQIGVWWPPNDQIGDIGTIPDWDRPFCMRGIEAGPYAHYHLALAVTTEGRHDEPR